MSTFYTSGSFAKSSSAVRSVSASVSSIPACFAGLHSSVVADAKSLAEDIVKGSISDDSSKKEDAVRPFGLQTDGRRYDRLIVREVEVV